MLSEPTFDILRTKEQLGYIVASTAWQSTASMGLHIVVQSEREPMYLEDRVEVFLQTMDETIDAMPETTFQDHRKGLQDKWTEKVKNLNEETNRYWTHIESGYLDFTRRQSPFYQRSVALPMSTDTEVPDR
jgi:insulysin